MTKPYGKLIGASLGPGDPELITRRSWAILHSEARWLYPVTRAEEKSYALSIVERATSGCSLARLMPIRLRAV